MSNIVKPIALNFALEIGVFQAGHVLCHRPPPRILYNNSRSERACAR